MPEISHDPISEHGRVGIAVNCVVCGQQKAPHGRSAPIGPVYCGGSECRGYDKEPHAGCLWPGETCEDFGYNHCHHATATVIRTAEESAK